MAIALACPACNSRYQLQKPPANGSFRCLGCRAALMVQPLKRSGEGLKRLVTLESIRQRRHALNAKPCLFFNPWQTTTIAVSLLICVLELTTGTRTAVFGAVHPTLAYLSCSLLGLGALMVFLRSPAGSKLVESGSWLLIAATALPALATLYGSDSVSTKLVALPAAFVEFAFASVLPVVVLYCVAHPRWGDDLSVQPND